MGSICEDLDLKLNAIEEALKSHNLVSRIHKKLHRKLHKTAVNRKHKFKKSIKVKRK